MTASAQQRGWGQPIFRAEVSKCRVSLHNHPLGGRASGMEPSTLKSGSTDKTGGTQISARPTLTDVWSRAHVIARRYRLSERLSHVARVVCMDTLLSFCENRFLYVIPDVQSRLFPPRSSLPFTSSTMPTQDSKFGIHTDRNSHGSTYGSLLSPF